MTSAGRIDRAEKRPFAASMNKVVATSSLSAIGSRKRPSSDCCCQARASRPSSQSVTPATENSAQPSHGPGGAVEIEGRDHQRNRDDAR